MGATTAISWPHHTFNPWIGCTHKSPGCEHCYAEAMAKAFGMVKWGAKAARRLTSRENWRKVLRWDRQAYLDGVRRRVFCASMADVFEDHPSIRPEWRAGLWELIARTRNLDWLLLTKRPENWNWALPCAQPGEIFAHVRLGVTIEDQRRFDERWPFLEMAHAMGWQTFVSYEPAIGPVDWRPALETGAIGWLICGGEDGPRPMHPAWARQARDQSGAYGVPFHLKQWGKWLPAYEDEDGGRSFWEADDGGPPGRFEGRKAKLIRLEDENRSDAAARFSPQLFAAVGKKHSGHLLDGNQHLEFPRASLVFYPPASHHRTRKLEWMPHHG